MKNYIEFQDLSAATIRQFVDQIAEVDPNYSLNPLFLLGKAAAYTDVAAALSIIELPEAANLLEEILVQALLVEFS